eukprot:Phypoly_transcript_22441.p1 GENE.Phypoly_transcript_22441~~Phypoly_transcript_22441.p1  ORF type:complete len:187 (+),score=24.15 Phypoly_transcript_22441:36-596(+)
MRNTLKFLGPVSSRFATRAPLSVCRYSHTAAFHLAGKTYFKKEKTEAELIHWLQERGKAGLPSYMGYDVKSVSEGVITAQMEIKQHHMASNGYVHAASIITLADTSCGFGCYVHLPPHATGFTTIELKSNFIGSATVGKTLFCKATLIHSGKSTQVWDAIVSEGGKDIAFFRCTEIILYKKDKDVK